MAYLFISYPRRQAEVVTRLQALLEARSIEVWRDTEQLRFGTAWDARVTAAIRGAAMVVLFQSEDWFASGPCRSEADQARYYHRPIVTLSAHDEALDLEAAAAFVAGRFAARPPEGDVVADLEVQAAQWAEGGRRVRDLARRRNLRRFVPLTSRADTVTELAEDFVRQSRRWRRIVRLALATLAVGVITSGAFVTLGAYQTARVDEADRAIAGRCCPRGACRWLTWREVGHPPRAGRPWMRRRSPSPRRGVPRRAARAGTPRAPPTGETFT